jgi:hypothetical protein
MRETDRGQSELLGYFLIFNLVVLTVLLVGATGIVGLDNAQDFQRTTSAQQGVSALANDVGDVARRGAPSRTTEIRLAEASLSLERTTNITVRTDSASIENETVQLHSLVYDSGSGTRIVYSSGAVLRADRDNSVMVREPNFLLGNDTVIVPIVTLSPADGDTVGGDTAVTVETTDAGTEVVGAGKVDTVTVEITSPHATAWYRYLDDEAECDPPNSGTVTCRIEADRVSVTVDRIDVRLE